VISVEADDEHLHRAERRFLLSGTHVAPRSFCF
jgi:hypothetical protein